MSVTKVTKLNRKNLLQFPLIIHKFFINLSRDISNLVEKNLLTQLLIYKI
jgi:hypothetical protein